MYDLVVYKYKCENGPAVTFIERDEKGLILRDYPVGCRDENIYSLLKSLKRLTENLPLEVKIRLFFKLLELVNYEPGVSPYIELSHLLEYYLF